mmetsp:Transcript_29696/g.47317  ORF Transcript_29696/g.47317 Transcript_29696/m.47317 type:complete len:80 (+) Transcript_29696:135-374(+)
MKATPLAIKKVTAWENETALPLAKKKVTPLVNWKGSLSDSLKAQWLERVKEANSQSVSASEKVSELDKTKALCLVQWKE